MIIRTQATFSAQGEFFKPSLAKLPYSSFHDTGAIGVNGLYKGLPTPYGTADFEAPENEPRKIQYLYSLVKPSLGVLREVGADSFCMHISYHADSGALGFSADELRMMAELECDLPIDLYLQNEND